MNATANTSLPAPHVSSGLSPTVRRAIAIALLGTGLQVAWNSPWLEPITGVGWGILIWVVGFYFPLAYCAVSALMRREFVIGIIVGTLGFVLTMPPAASKPGATLTVVNQTSEAVRVRLAGADTPERSTTLNISAGKQATHRTAPGDYSENFKVEFSAGGQRLTATIGELRSKRVSVTSAGLRLVEFGKDEP